MCKPNSLMKTVTVRDAHTNPILSYCVHAYTKGICLRNKLQLGDNCWRITAETLCIVK